MARLLFLFTLCVGIGAKDVSGLSCEYEMTVDHALYGENVDMLKNSDPAACKEACDALGDGCKSFDFNANSGSCFLSDETKDTAPDMFGKHAKMDYFQKTTCADGETTTDNNELPLDVDCPSGWVGGQHGQCYMLDHECSLTWENAKEQCNNIGAYLLAIDDFSELTYIRELLENEDQYVRWWTSGYREKYTDTWKWDDGDQSDVEVFDWHYPEPNNFKGREDKIAIMYDETAWAYNDDSPNALRSFICEAKPQEIRVGCDASPCLHGGRCVTIYGDDNNLDTGLLTTKDEENQVQFLCHCDDKYKGPTCQYDNPDYADQTMWHTIGDSQYHFHNECGLSRNNARRHCEVENGDLVALESQQEMREVKELIEELGLTENIDYFWTSGAKLGDSWYWEYEPGGEKPGVTSMYMDWGWIEGEPNGWLGKENYTEWRFGDVYGFNDVGEKKKNAYICEKAAPIPTDPPAEETDSSEIDIDASEETDSSDEEESKEGGAPPGYESAAGLGLANWYKAVVDHPLNWYNANSACEADGAMLVSINSPLEFNFQAITMMTALMPQLAELGETNQPDEIMWWVGAYKNSRDKAYWVDFTTLRYTDLLWFRNQPDNESHYSIAFKIDQRTQDSGLDDQDGDIKLNYICEYKKPIERESEEISGSGDNDDDDDDDDDDNSGSGSGGGSSGGYQWNGSSWVWN